MATIRATESAGATSATPTASTTSARTTNHNGPKRGVQPRFEHVAPRARLACVTEHGCSVLGTGGRGDAVERTELQPRQRVVHRQRVPHVPEATRDSDGAEPRHRAAAPSGGRDEDDDADDEQPDRHDEAELDAERESRGQRPRARVAPVPGCRRTTNASAARNSAMPTTSLRAVPACVDAMIGVLITTATADDAEPPRCPSLRQAEAGEEREPEPHEVERRRQEVTAEEQHRVGMQQFRVPREERDERVRRR